jgi:hypothetical protein
LYQASHVDIGQNPTYETALWHRLSALHAKAMSALA